MKALVYTGPQQLSFCERPEPVCEPGAAVLDVAAVGICGSDMHAYLGHDPRRPAPLILGHEVAGRLGEGTRVTVNPLVTCAACEDCHAGQTNLCTTRQIISMPPREGGFATRLGMPRQNLIAVPEGVSDVAAALVEPLACGWHGVRRGFETIRWQPEEAICLVIGGGAIGLGAALVLAAQGARQVWLAEPHPARRAAVAAAGDFRVFDPATEPGPGEDAAHLVIDGVGFEATRAAACRAARRGGAIVHIGLGHAASGLDVRRLTLAEIAFLGVYTYTEADFRDTAAALFAGRLGALDWVETRPLAEGARAFADLQAGRVSAPKIVLCP